MAVSQGKGTPIFSAPEMAEGGSQTPKADVWSLYATLVWVLDIDGFRAAPSMHRTADECWRAVLAVASRQTILSLVQEMARRDVDQRASAAQMLVKHFKGQGLTTSRSRVPPLQGNTPTQAVQATHAPAMGPPPRPAWGQPTNMTLSFAGPNHQPVQYRPPTDLGNP